MCEDCNEVKQEGVYGIEDGVLPLVKALNTLPNVHTFNSCEGHEDRKRIFFLPFRDNPLDGRRVEGVMAGAPLVCFQSSMKDAGIKVLDKILDFEWQIVSWYDGEYRFRLEPECKVDAFWFDVGDTRVEDFSLYKDGDGVIKLPYDKVVSEYDALRLNTNSTKPSLREIELIRDFKLQIIPISHALSDCM